MIRRKVVIILSAVIIGTALIVYALTKNAYDTPVVQIPITNINTSQAAQIIDQSSTSMKSHTQNQDVTLSLQYAGSEKSHYYALLEFTLPEGTKTYWKRAGFGGINPEFDFSESKNIRATDIIWGTPKKYSNAGIINYVLGKDPKILIKISPEKLSDLVHLKGIFHYGYCDTQCKAGSKEIDLTITPDMISDITATNRHDIIKHTPVPLEDDTSEIEIFDLKEKIDRKSHIISFTFEDEKPFREENLYYSFDIQDYEIMRPLIQNIYEGRRRITIDMVGLSETPKEIEIIYQKDDGASIVKKYHLSFERYN